ncbi:hypothetical protein [Mycolicibacterium bacteremicum]|uniref:hypothetical protein n=1 Tax=Mycolicibacterium bacteremicum TaxID=564198 RepID=UPI0021F3A6B2|nr:hypothetical protein [Mycolicibacterium bacteremicum]
MAELGHPGQGEPPGGQHLGGHRRAFGAQLVARGIEVGPHISTVEHVCDYATGHRQYWSSNQSTMRT